MSVHNVEIAAIFNKLADLLEIDGDNPFRVRAYREAARVIGGHSRSMADMVSAGEDLERLPGIGKEIAKKVATIVETGSLPQLAEIEQRVPEELSELMHIGGLGPKRVKALYDALDIDSIDDLQGALEAGKVRALSGFGAKTEELIRAGIARLRGAEKRLRLADAEQLAEPLAEYLAKVAGVKDIVVAGSYRRRRDTVGDLDLLVTAKKGSRAMDRFRAYNEVSEVVSSGSTRSTVRLRSGLQVDLRVVPAVSFGAALHYFTGSKAHNIAVRKLGVRRDLKINEYGVFRGKKRIAGRTEEEVYKAVDLPFIEPELREDTGEIEAAQQGRLPKLVQLADVRGDLHMHTRETDGHDTLEDMARAARERGYEYIAITDHSRRLRVAHGLDEKRLRGQIEAIDRLNEKLEGFAVLKAIEVDILEDGSLDLPDAVLAALDLRVCSVHYKFGLSRAQQTERIIRAMDNPYFNILAHPTGRLINEREAYEVDLERVMSAAHERGCHLELNAQPSRMDLGEHDCRMARDMGVGVVISTDAHRTGDLDYMRFGVGQARRGWLEAGDVLNTQALGALRKQLERR